MKKLRNNNRYKFARHSFPETALLDISCFSPQNILNEIASATGR